MFIQFSQQMRDFVGWKNAQCPFERNSAILQYLLTAPAYTEKREHIQQEGKNALNKHVFSDMSLLSFECEAPEHTLEKEQYKKLRYGFRLVVDPYQNCFARLSDTRSDTRRYASG